MLAVYVLGASSSLSLQLGRLAPVGTPAPGGSCSSTFGVHATLLAAGALAVFPLLLPIPIFYYF